MNPWCLEKKESNNRKYHPMFKSPSPSDFGFTESCQALFLKMFVILHEKIASRWSYDPQCVYVPVSPLLHLCTHKYFSIPAI